VLKWTVIGVVLLVSHDQLYFGLVSERRTGFSEIDIVSQFFMRFERRERLADDLADQYADLSHPE